MLDLILSIIEMGSIYTLLVLAVHITSDIIGIDDFSIEGSFAVGGALGVVLTNLSLPTAITVCLVVGGGALVGLLTAGLYTLAGIDSLLCGIIITTGLFSCNLKIAGAQASLEKSLFEQIPALASNHWLLLVPVSVVTVATAWWLLRTEIGLGLRAVGDNPHMLTNMGKSANSYITLGLCIANALSALAGLLFVHHTGFYSITGRIGTLISALAGLIIGKAILGKNIGSVWVGAVLYQTIIGAVIYLQWDPAWNKLITALVIVILVLLKHLKKHEHRRIS